MNKCQYCEKEVPQKDGKRARLFCNGNCRNKYYYQKQAANKPKKKVGRPKKMSANPSEQKAAESTQKETASTSINLNGFHLKLHKIKMACPTELKGIDRSMWIDAERKKQGI